MVSWTNSLNSQHESRSLMYKIHELFTPVRKLTCSYIAYILVSIMLLTCLCIMYILEFMLLFKFPRVVCTRDWHVVCTVVCTVVCQWISVYYSLHSVFSSRLTLICSSQTESVIFVRNYSSSYLMQIAEYEVFVSVFIHFRSSEKKHSFSFVYSSSSWYFSLLVRGEIVYCTEKKHACDQKGLRPPMLLPILRQQ